MGSSRRPPPLPPAEADKEFVLRSARDVTMDTVPFSHCTNVALFRRLAARWQSVFIRRRVYGSSRRLRPQGGASDLVVDLLCFVSMLESTGAPCFGVVQASSNAPNPVGDGAGARCAVHYSVSAVVSDRISARSSGRALLLDRRGAACRQIEMPKEGPRGKGVDAPTVRERNLHRRISSRLGRRGWIEVNRGGKLHFSAAVEFSSSTTFFVPAHQDLATPHNAEYIGLELP
jgi:hypothetical protein